jgi:hypothetical protein
MKPFKIILIALIGLLITAVQPAKAQTVNSYFTENEWYKSVTPAATDTTYGTAEKSKVFFVNKTEGYKYVYQMSGTRRNTTGDGTFTLYGSIDGVNYYPIATRTWLTSTADTTIYFTTTSNVGWRYLKGGLKGTASGTKLTLGNERVAVFK